MALRLFIWYNRNRHAILDKYGNKTGKTKERVKPMEMIEGEYYLMVDIWILNNQGEFLISKRVPTVNPEPDRWQPTCGCVIAGEDSISAALREVNEELGLVLSPKNSQLVKRYIAWDKAIIDVWLFRQDFLINEVVLQPTETNDAMWSTKDSIIQLINDDRFICYERVPYINELFLYCRL